MKNSPCKDLFVLVLMTFALFAFKALWAVLISSGPIIPDELRYKFNASAIFALQKYATAHHPPAYSLALAPALFFKHWYEVMLVFNAFWSSLVVPATWFLARSAGIKQPLIAALLAGLLPIHAIYPHMLLSENMFVPLFVIAMALALRGGQCGNVEALAFGFILGISHLTKYLFLPALPIFFGAWLYLRSKSKHKAPSESLLNRYRPAFPAFCAYGLIIGIWLYYGRASGFSLSQLFGFGISGIKADAANIHSLLLWATAYTSYVILSWLPVWGIIAIWASQLSAKAWRINLKQQHWHLLVFVLLLIVCYWLLAVQHSFGARYNYPVPQRLLGRYLMQLSPIMLVAGIWVLERIAENPLPLRKVKALIGVGVLAGFASLSWWVLFNNGIWAFGESIVTHHSNMVDVVALVSTPVFLSALFTVLLLLAIICFRSNDIRFLVLPIIMFLSVSLAVDARTMQTNQDGLHSRQLAATVIMLDQQSDAVHIYFEGISHQMQYKFKDRMLFWGVKQSKLSAEMFSYENGIRFASFSSPTLFLTSVYFNINPLRKYIVNDKRYYIYRIDGLDPKMFPSGTFTSENDDK